MPAPHPDRRSSVCPHCGTLRSGFRAAVRDAWRFVLSIVRDPTDGSFSAVDLGSIVGIAALTKGFLAEAATRELDWLTFVGYGAAVVLVSGAPLADRVISIMPGSQRHVPAPPVTTSPPA